MSSISTKPPKYAAIKRLALVLPEAHEIASHHGYWFNVGKKTFVCHWFKGPFWVFKLPRDRQEILFEARPETFTPMIAGRMVWSYVRVEDLDNKELKDLVSAAWSTVAKRQREKKA